MPLPAHSDEVRLAWSEWRRAKREQVRRSHYRQRERQSNVQVEYDDTS